MNMRNRTTQASLLALVAAVIIIVIQRQRSRQS